MFRDRSFHRAVALALVVHGLGLLAVFVLGRRDYDESPPAATRALRVALLSLEDQSDTVQSPPELGATIRDTMSRLTDKQATRPHTNTASPANGISRARAAHTMGKVVSHLDLLTAKDESTSDRTPEPPVAQLPTAPPPASPPKHAGLTREQLGLGSGDHATGLTETSPVRADMQARLRPSERLSRSIQQHSVDSAGKLGLGEEGPILAKLERLVQQSSSNVTGSATVSARILENGKLDLELIGSTSDRAAWNRLLARAKSELSTQRLKVPSGSRGIDLEIHVASRIQLPDGSDPGLAVKALGIPLKNGEGKRSPAIELLSKLPGLKLDLGNPDPAMRQRLELEVLKVPLDPTTWTGKRYRITSARVTRRTLLRAAPE